jgi:hypothetical protein
MVGHQDISLDGAAMLARGMSEPFVIEAVVLIFKKIAWRLLPRWITCSG